MTSRHYRAPSGPVAAASGIGMLLLGFFIGENLRGLEALGFAIVLAGSLTLLYGVLRWLEDREN